MARFFGLRSSLTASAASSCGVGLAVLSVAVCCACTAPARADAPAFPPNFFAKPDSNAAPMTEPRRKGAPSFGLDGPRVRSQTIEGLDRRQLGREFDGDVVQEPQHAPEAPKPPADPAQARQALLTALYERLQKSGDNDEAEGVAGAIERVWFESGSDTADLLMTRAVAAVESKDYRLGREIISKIVVIDPTWAEAWNQYAVARALSGDMGGAVEDLSHVLALEPRHFGALTGLGAILLRTGDKKGALRVFRRTLEIYPRLAPIRKTVDRLTIQVEGRDL